MDTPQAAHRSLPVAAPADSVSRSSLRRAIAAAAIGNMLEWYDFTVYALFATYIANAFFANHDPATALIGAFLTFGAGFVIRPLGAILIGDYGDRAGRKAALTLTILLMALGTLLIAIAPTYAAIGVGAPLMLLFGRLLQGLSAGGEVGSASAFLVESAPAGQRGTVAAWLEASMGVSNILGALVAFVVTSSLSAQQLQTWGWRVPFIVGLLIVPAGLLLRRTLSETAEFNAVLAQRQLEPATAQAPLLATFVAHGRDLLIGFGICILWAVAVYVLIVYTPVYAHTAFGFPASQAFAASMIGNLLFVPTCLIAGRLSDRIGRARALLLSALALLVCVLPLYWVLQTHSTELTLILVQSALCVLVAAFVSVAPAALADLFPAKVRSTGIALVYNAAFTIFGGFAAAILTWATHRFSGFALAPAWYVTAAAAVTLLTLWPFHRRLLAARALALTGNALAS